jgi:hypothetical protein
MIAIMDILKSARAIISRMRPGLVSVDSSLVEVEMAAMDILGADSLDHVLETLVAVYGQQPTKRVVKPKRLTLNRPLVLDRATRRAMERATTQPAIGSLNSTRGS